MLQNLDLFFLTVGASFVVGFFFSLGVASASRFMPVLSARLVDVNMTYDNLEKPNHKEKTSKKAAKGAK